MVTAPILEIKNLSLNYQTRRGDVGALRGINFSVEQGKAVGLIGESGSGKTSIANCIMRLLPENARIISGKIIFQGADLLALSDEDMRKIRGQKISLVFQAAMNALNPVIKVGDQITEAIQVHQKMRKHLAAVKAGELFRLVGLDSFRLNNYPHEYSGGMKQRSVIAMALSCEPELVIADEPTTALDVIVQAQIMEEIMSLQKKLGMTLLYISHDIAVIAGVCQKTGVMYAGNLVEYASTSVLIRSPLHPYAKGLVGSLPSITGEKRRIESIPGEVPDLLNPPPGCPFHPRCFRAQAICREKIPGYREIKPERFAACHFPLTEGGS